MKKYLVKYLLLFAFIIVGCKSNIENHEGYIYDYNTKMPLSNIEICPEHSNENKKCVKTDKKGFFKTNYINLSRCLYVYINGKLSDSIQTVRTNGGEKYNEYYINGRKDTVFIDMKQQKIIRE